MAKMREKLIKILRVPIFPHELVDPTEAVADYLLDNDVIPVVRCKDCYLGENCTCVCCEDGEMVLCRNRHKHMPADAFCSDGWRAEDG